METLVSRADQRGQEQLLRLTVERRPAWRAQVTLQAEARSSAGVGLTSHGSHVLTHDSLFDLIPVAGQYFYHTRSGNVYLGEPAARPASGPVTGRGARVDQGTGAGRHLGAFWSWRSLSARSRRSCTRTGGWCWAARRKPLLTALYTIDLTPKAPGATAANLCVRPGVAPPALAAGHDVQASTPPGAARTRHRPKCRPDRAAARSAHCQVRTRPPEFTLILSCSCLVERVCQANKVSRSEGRHGNASVRTRPPCVGQRGRGGRYRSRPESDSLPA